MKMKRLVSVLLSAALVCGLGQMTVLATYPDSEGHWAAEAIDRWEYSEVFATGEKGGFLPGQTVTGQELYDVLTRWFDGNTVPIKGVASATVTRQEAVAAIAQTAGLSPAATPNIPFADQTRISDDCAGWVNAMAQAGYIQGIAGSFTPEAPITRAEVLTILDNIAVAGARKALTATASTGVYTGQVTREGLVKFSNVTFATAERWQKPQAVPASDEAIAADARQTTVTVQNRAPGVPQTEEKLTLDLYVNPKGDSDNKAVFVWNTCGGGTGSNSNAFDPVRLVSEHPEIMVAVVNIRVSYFGCIDLSVFPDYEEQRETYEHSNNLMRLDYLEALKWINENIAAFGGDLDNVTLGGQSAGAANCSAMLLMEEAHPYFNQVVMESGVAIDRISLATLEESRAAAEIFMESTGATTLADALKLEPENVLKAQDALTANCIGAYMPDSQSKTFTTVVDDVVVHQDYWSAIETAAQSGIKILVGATNGEYDRDLTGKSAEDALKEIVAANWGKLDPTRGGSEQAQTIIQGYVDRSEAYGRDTVQVYKDLKNDINQKASACMIAEAFSKQSTAYLFSYEYYAENADGNRAVHGSEKNALYGVADAVPQNMAKAMRNAWASFIRCGDPNLENPYFSQADIKWTPYDRANKWTMIFDETLRIEQGQRVEDVESLLPLFIEYQYLRQT